MVSKVIIQQVNSFKITIDGKEYHDFEKVSEWNGMLEFKGPSGVIIVHKEEDMLATFATVFGNVKQKKEVEFSIAKISPSLVSTEGK